MVARDPRNHSFVIFGWTSPYLLLHHPSFAPFCFCLRGTRCRLTDTICCVMSHTITCVWACSGSTSRMPRDNYQCHVPQFAPIVSQGFSPVDLLILHASSPPPWTPSVAAATMTMSAVPPRKWQSRLTRSSKARPQRSFVKTLPN